MLLLFTAGALAEYPPGNPAAYWSFDECQGTVAHDQSGNGHDLTFDATYPPEWSTGRVGGCAISTRNGFASALNADDLDHSGSYSVAAWVYRDTAEQPLNHAVVGMHYCTVDNDRSWDLNFMPEQAEGDVIFLRAFSSYGVAHYYAAAGAYIYNVHYPEWGEIGYGPVPAATDAWTHIAVTYDRVAQVASVYFNGTLVRRGLWQNPETGGSLAELVVGTDHLLPEGSLCGSSHFFQGDVDEIVIYNEALSDEQIATLAESTSNVGDDVFATQYWCDRSIGCGVRRFDGSGVDQGIFAYHSSMAHRLHDLAFTRDGQYMLVAAPQPSYGQLLRFDAATGAYVDHLIDSTDGMTGMLDITLGPGELLYLADGPGTVYEFDMQSGSLTPIISGLDAPWGMTLCPLNGNLLVSSYYAHKVLEYTNDSGNWTWVRDFTDSSLHNPYDLTCSPDGTVYVTSSADDVIVEFDYATATKLREFGGGAISRPIDVAFGPHGNLFVASFNTNDITEYDISTGQPISPPFVNFGGSLDLFALAFAPAGPVCGDGLCDVGEDYTECPQDCAECYFPADCDDGNDCTLDECIAHSCQYASKPCCSNGYHDPGEEGIDCGGTCHSECYNIAFVYVNPTDFSLEELKAEAGPHVAFLENRLAHQTDWETRKKINPIWIPNESCRIAAEVVRDPNRIKQTLRKIKDCCNGHNAELYVGITDDNQVRSATLFDQDTIILGKKGFSYEAGLMHEFGHAVLMLCDEYNYDQWNIENNADDFFCRNTYPLYCNLCSGEHPCCPGHEVDSTGDGIRDTYSVMGNDAINSDGYGNIESQGNDPAFWFVQERLNEIDPGVYRLSFDVYRDGRITLEEFSSFDSGFPDGFAEGTYYLALVDSDQVEIYGTRFTPVFIALHPAAPIDVTIIDRTIPMIEDTFTATIRDQYNEEVLRFDVLDGSLDRDLDGIIDDGDNCVFSANPQQDDRDNDAIGDICDNCFEVSNPEQADIDGDGMGDVCDVEAITYDGDTLLSTDGAATIVADLVGSLRGLDDVVLDLDAEQVTFTLFGEGIEAFAIMVGSQDGVATSMVALQPAIYTIEITAAGWDAVGHGILVVYNPEGGFATGGGWIMPADDGLNTHPNVRANFGFNAKYKQGLPTGHIEFRYSDGHIDLKSSSIEQLVITGGSIVQFKGLARVNGEDGHWFFAKAIDHGEPGAGADTFEIKIWGPGVDPEGDPTERAGGVLQGGNIVVHAR